MSLNHALEKTHAYLSFYSILEVDSLLLSKARRNMQKNFALPLLSDIVCSTQVLYKKAFAEARGDLEFEFIKFHLLVHYPHSIMLYVSQVPLTGYWWEASLKTLVKIPYRSISKKIEVCGDKVILNFESWFR